MADRRRGAGKRVVSDSKPYTRPSAPEGSWKHDKVQDRPQNTNATGSGDTIAVSNLHYEVMPSDLTTIFEAVGGLAREPTIKYDRSGRSLGIAFVQYVNPRDARIAIERLDGMTAKGKPMRITVDHGRKTSAVDRPPPTGPKNSLLTRIGSAPLVNRVAKTLPETPSTGKTERNRVPPRGRGGGGSGGAGKPGTAKSKPARVPKVPKTVEDLDRELEAYLDTDKNEAPPAAVDATTATGVPAEDTDMA